LHKEKVDFQFSNIMLDKPKVDLNFMKATRKPMPDTACHPLLQLSEEDLNMVTAFVLVSGSIKDLARQYGISYPTMRQRLDRLIERVQKLVEGAPSDPLSDYLADLLSRGLLTANVARRIRELHRAALPEPPQGDECNE
jgi:hypothetical protein